VPALIGQHRLSQQAVVYDLLFKASAETLITIAAIQGTSVPASASPPLHSWGSAMTITAMCHMIVPGGGISLDGNKWVSCRPGFFLPVRVLCVYSDGCFWRSCSPAQGRPFRFFGEHAAPPTRRRSRRIWHAAPNRMGGLCKRPFGGPEACWPICPLYPPRRHRQQRLIACDRTAYLPVEGLSCRWSRAAEDHDITTGEFIRRFLSHVLRTASTASATTACSPAARAPATSPSSPLARLPAAQPGTVTPSLQRDQRAEVASVSVLRRSHDIIERIPWSRHTISLSAPDLSLPAGPPP